ncbi:MAG: DNA primase [Verrucomicrobiota bacterium]
MAGISPEMIEKVRQSVDIVDVIGEYVSLKRAGAYYKALSPFQKEKTPSFMISPSRQSFKCYSSGHGGDVFKFVMLHDHLDFPAAVRKLAEKAGIEIPESDYRGGNTPSKASREGLLKLHGALALHWRDILLKDKSAEIARAYLKSRNITSSWVKEFCLGYAPDSWNATLEWAKKNGFTQTQLSEAGLVIIPEEENQRPYDRFRGRLMFPIKDEGGRIVAFSGRMMKDDKEVAKYVNSPETIIFKKGKILFGLDRAKKAILDAGSVVICEGQIDVLRCHNAGILNVVAPLGTAFTRDHCKILKRFADRIILCLDADRAGQASAARLGEMLAEEQGNSVLAESDFGIQVVSLPEGHDPDSLINEQGADAFRALLNHPVDFLDFYIAHITSKEKHDTPSARRRIVEAVTRLIAKIENAVVRDHIINQAANKLGLAPSILNGEIARLAQKKTFTEREEEIIANEKIAPLSIHPLIKDAIVFVLADPTLVPEFQRLLKREWLQDVPGSPLFEKIMMLYTQEKWSRIAELHAYTDAVEQNFLSGIAEEQLEILAELPEKKRSQNIALIIEFLEMEYLNRQIIILSQQLKTLDGTPEQQREWAEQLAQWVARKNLLIKNLKRAN